MSRKGPKNKPTKNAKNKKSVEQIQQVVAQQFQGPLPPPAMLEDYGRIIENGPERLFAMVEREGEHRQYCEKKTVDSSAAFLKSSATDARLGLVLGFVIALLFLLGSVYVVISGYPVAGTVLGSLDLAALVGVFVYGSKNAGSSNNHT